MNLINFYDPNIEFGYINDDTLWEKLFHNPFPKDIQNVRKGSVILSNYFDVQLKFIDTERGYKKERKFLSPKEIFFDIDQYKRNTVFTALCDFLIRFKRPYRDCYLMLPYHPESRYEPMGYPSSLYYRTPQYPDIDKEKNIINFTVNLDVFNALCLYSFNQEMGKEEGDYTIGYAFDYFCGFVLDH